MNDPKAAETRVSRTGFPMHASPSTKKPLALRVALTVIGTAWFGLMLSAATLWALRQVGFHV
jgi:hypothetical protein